MGKRLWTHAPALPWKDGRPHHYKRVYLGTQKKGEEWWGRSGCVRVCVAAAYTKIMIRDWEGGMGREGGVNSEGVVRLSGYVRLARRLARAKMREAEENSSSVERKLHARLGHSCCAAGCHGKRGEHKRKTKTRGVGGEKSARAWRARGDEGRTHTRFRAAAAVVKTAWNKEGVQKWKAGVNQITVS